MDQISTPKISEILKEEFMIPFNLSAYALAKAIHVPVSRIQDILNDHRKITVDTSIRLAKFFGVSDKYFLNLQNDIDIRNAEAENAQNYKEIELIQ
ncbi:transcriptional regulator [Ligilactobacillus aviarius]|uniref:HigA family addiction module antitoxin n=1 Tax=Ligilactobacillus aviarius TaxID=1606 RepID=UPI0007D8EB36|nr:HigA family addiction module antitoxin [Ligilactobacillus aviarius]OAQ01809.1 transcriptional regulator [Ligilactobacillus aviarius]OAQ02690.1 transcriptional regulator [Ligilactobacillus aviarius]OAS78290.1 transcriptional regulator [Ligilactobacillus aviarius]